MQQFHDDGSVSLKVVRDRRLDPSGVTRIL